MDDLNWDKSGSNRKIGYGDIEVGAFDINDDSIEEVFLKFNFGCGNYAGCEILVYNIKDGKWRELLSLSGHGLDIVMDPREDYYTLFEWQFGYCWNGKKYIDYSFDEYTRFPCKN